MQTKLNLIKLQPGLCTIYAILSGNGAGTPGHSHTVSFLFCP